MLPKESPQCKVFDPFSWLSCLRIVISKMDSAGQGYHGEISILVGLADENTVKGIIVLSQAETPGLGSQLYLRPHPVG